MISDSSTIRARAAALRQEGYTYTEICTRLGPIPKATLAYWCRSIRLSEQQQFRIQQKVLAGGAQSRPLAVIAWANKVRKWQEQIERRVAPFGRLPYNDPHIGKLVLGVMYLCEGGRYPASRFLMFGNTNPQVISTFLSLLRDNYQLNEGKFRVRIVHRWDQDGAALKRYWSRITAIPIRQFHPSYPDKRTQGAPTRRSNYQGVCCIQYLSTDLQYELQAIGESIFVGRSKSKVEQTGIGPVASAMPSRRSPS